MTYVFGDIFDPKFESDMRIFTEKSFESELTHDLRMATRTHVVFQYIPEYEHHTYGIPHRPTPEQALKGQHNLIDIF